MRKWGKKLGALALASMVAVSSFAIAANTFQAEKEDNKQTKNVIMLIMDGSSNNVSTLARWYSGDVLALDSILTGGVRTYSAASAITDSAAAGTALATGNKSNSSYVGVLPTLVNSPGLEPVAEKDAFKPVANVLEGAKLAGKATGLISTSEIQHATPAAFSSHVTSRKNYDDISEQQVYQNIDVVLGGGYNSLNEKRKDGENLINELKNHGYAYLSSRDDLLTTEANKYWGMFAPGALAYDIDRATTKPTEPTLAEMTAKAISTLNKDEDGFFLLVEGSQIDWAAHANDPIGMIGDFLAFDDAVEEAVKFAEKDGETLVIAVTDHGNSGITMGNINTNNTYATTPVSAYIDPLKEASMTVTGALSQLKEDKSNLVEVAALYGLKDLTADELAALTASEKLSATLVTLLAERANLGFTTGGHTGDDIFLYAYGPNKPTGLVENTDLAKIMAASMGFDLATLTTTLFNDAEVALVEKGFTVAINAADTKNPVLVATKGDKVFEIPENKNIVIDKSNGAHKTIKVKSVNVYNDKKFFISKEALDAID